MCRQKSFFCQILRRVAAAAVRAGGRVWGGGGGAAVCNGIGLHTATDSADVSLKTNTPCMQQQKDKQNLCAPPAWNTVSYQSPVVTHTSQQDSQACIA